MGTGLAELSVNKRGRRRALRTPSKESDVGRSLRSDLFQMWGEVLFLNEERKGMIYHRGGGARGSGSREREEEKGSEKYKELRR